MISRVSRPNNARPHECRPNGGKPVQINVADHIPVESALKTILGARESTLEFYVKIFLAVPRSNMFSCIFSRGATLMLISIQCLDVNLAMRFDWFAEFHSKTPN